VVWFYSGQELPAHSCSQAWIRAEKVAITLKQTSLKFNILIHNIIPEISLTRKGIGRPNSGRTRRGAGGGGG